ncbi:MAG TPA: ABC transporter ATP-binding protein [Burkholderiales bacterium]|jgi:branched-chain amino acid transport system ATP-binding protein|nr:ABC transporter ATP-binding protein [Burkholderiales bacterium]
MAQLLEAKGLNKSFGAVTAAADINVSIERDTVVGLIGSNGAGKTTFLNMVTGYLKPSSGQILFEGRDITALTPRRITRLGVCRSFQIPQLFDSLSVHDNLLIGVGIVASAGSQWTEAAAHAGTPEEAVEASLQRFRLGAYRDKLAGQLPEGVRKLLDIAMAMVVKPRMLLLDEPTSGVSADEKFELMDMVMEAVRAQGVTVLFVEHDMEIVKRYTHRVLAFYEGRIIADGEPAVVLEDSEVRKYVIGERLHIGAGRAAH